MKRIMVLAIVWVLASAGVMQAQGSVDAEAVYLWTGGTQRVKVTTGSGAASSTTTGDVYVDYATGDLYTRRSGSSSIAAQLDRLNIFTVQQEIAATSPLSYLTATGQGSNLKTWRWAVVGQDFRLDTVDDAKSSVLASPLTINRTTNLATVLGGVSVGGTSDLTGNVTVHANASPAVNYTSNLGSITNKYLSIWGAELNVETLVAQNVVATIGGRVMIAPSNLLTADLAPAATLITVKYNNLVNGDRLYMESTGKVEWMAVTSSAGGSSGAYTYTVTRNLDGSGADQWYAGDAVVDTGTTGNGYIDLYSTSSVVTGGTGPTITGNVRTGTTYSNIAPRWGIGNLNNLCGYAASDIYGAFFGDCGASNITIDATNGVRIRDGVTNKLVLSGGNLTLTGDIIMSTSGVFRAGATAFGTGTGWYLDYNGGTPRFIVGNPSGNRVKYDGTNVEVVSGNFNVNAGGVSIADSTSYDSTRSYSFTNSIGTNQTFYGLYATSTSAPNSEVGVLNRGTASGSTGYIVRLESQSDTKTSTILLTTPGSGSGGASISMSSGTTIVTAGGFQVGSPTGGDKGNGTINIQGDIYKNNTAYTNPDYVFEHWATGRIERYAKNPGAATYAGLLPLNDLKAYVREHYRFPRISDESVGLFQRGDAALELIEQNTLYLFQLEARVAALESQLKGGLK